MTHKLAKEIFDTLLALFQENGFTDTVTFAIPQSTDDTQFSTFAEDYAYISTETEVTNLIAQSNNTDGAEVSLNRLVKAGYTYFSIAQNIPDSYAGKMEAVFKDTDQIPNTKILLATNNEQLIDLNNLIDNESVKQVISLLNFINENSDLDDTIFLEELDHFLTDIK